MRTHVLLFALLLGTGAEAFASGHGPVFGFATPVNSQGEWSFDAGMFGRNATFGSQLTARTMASYGFTPHLQFSLIAPALAQQGSLPMTMMSGGGEFQTNLAWRFHHQPNAIGSRFESTASVDLVVPGPQDNFGMFRGMRLAPGVSSWIATGVASRSHYLWIGGGLMRFAESQGDRRPNVYSTSFVYGYRPHAWRNDRPWDWRLFAEFSGEYVGLMERAGALMPGSDASQIFGGPTVLGIYKYFAISGGAQFPIYRDMGRLYPRERVRFAINVSYFLFSHSH